MNNDEFREKIKRSVAQAIEDKRDLDGLVGILKKILYYEISAFSDRIKAHEPLDLALISYKGRHWVEVGYEKRGLELGEAINKELEGYKEPSKPLEPTNPPPSIITAQESGGEVKTEAVTIS